MRWLRLMSIYIEEEPCEFTSQQESRRQNQQGLKLLLFLFFLCDIPVFIETHKLRTIQKKQCKQLNTKSCTE